MKKTISALMLGTALMLGAASGALAQDKTIKIGNLTDMSGLYADVGGQGSTTPPTDPPPAADWHSIVNKTSGKCVDAKAAGTTNGTVIQQYACNATNAQQYQLATTSGGYVRINNKANSAQVLDVTNVSTADNAKIQTWAYGGGANQQWQPVDEGGGYYHFVNRNSGKCLDVPGASTADGVQLVQYTCNGTGAQSFRLA